MASFEDFDDRDWRETLAELRLMVAGAGFIEWDAAAAANLDDIIDGRPAPKTLLLQYARSFESFLEVRSKSNLERMREELGDILRDENGLPVNGAIITDNDGDRSDEILDGQPSDGLLKVVRAFANALEGQSGYFDDKDAPQ